MILFPLTIWLRIILLLSPSMSMSRVVTLWPSIKSVSNFQILFVCWFYNFFPSLKLHILMPYHILWCRILQFLWHEDHGRGQKLQLLEMTIKGYYYPMMRFLFLGNLLVVAVIFVILSLWFHPLSGMCYNYSNFENWRCVVFFKLLFLSCTDSLNHVTLKFHGVL